MLNGFGSDIEASCANAEFEVIVITAKDNKAIAFDFMFDNIE